MCINEPKPSNPSIVSEPLAHPKVPDNANMANPTQTHICGVLYVVIDTAPWSGWKVAKHAETVACGDGEQVT